jgi:hypothetical protein
VALTTHPPSSSEVEKEQGYTYTPLLGFHENYFELTDTQHNMTEEFLE